MSNPMGKSHRGPDFLLQPRDVLYGITHKEINVVNPARAVVIPRMKLGGLRIVMYVTVLNGFRSAPSMPAEIRRVRTKVR